MFFKSLKLFWPQESNGSGYQCRLGTSTTPQFYTDAHKPANNQTARSPWELEHEDRLCAMLGLFFVTTWFRALNDAFLSTRVEILHKQFLAYYL